MINGIPKISVLIICYKQEELIKRAINSLLAQKEYIYEICVSDDCSPDKTWEVLQEYDKQYPGLFKLHRNNPNIGIFENIEYTWTMPSGDLVYRLAGDDVCGEGWLKTVVEYVLNNGINYKDELLCVYGDYKMITPDGKEYHRSNSLVVNHNDVIRLAIRGLVCNRGCCYSTQIVKKFVKCSKGRSHEAEAAIDRQLQLFAETNYYIPAIGNVYYSGIGVSTSIFNKKTYEERQLIMPYLEYFLNEHGYYYSKKDKYLTKLYKCRDQYMMYRTLSSRVRYIYYLVLTFDCSIESVPKLIKSVLSTIFK